MNYFLCKIRERIQRRGFIAEEYVWIFAFFDQIHLSLSNNLLELRKGYVTNPDIRPTMQVISQTLCI